ncbi:Sodium/hydrogen exchanger family-domain-containing protein [Mycena floridula]|nr:Sodium/hydrogen exchanger family-domain-containing protein [Mycena floridula]
MAFHPFEVSIPHVAYAVLGGFVVLFGMFSLFLREKLYIGEACWAFLFGVIIGPYGADIFDPRGWSQNEQDSNTIVLEVSRVVLAIGVFAIGVELPKAYMARHWKSLFFLLGPVMTWGWFVSAGLIFALIPDLSFLSSLAVAACLTPTDPILAAAVVGGKYADKHVPAHLRHLLAAESGCNDGAAFPFLYIALYLIIDGPQKGKAIREWFLLLWLYQVILGVCIGASIGFAFRYLMKFCQRKNLIDRHSYVAQYISLAMLTIGVTTLLGSDDLLSAFACGTAFAWDGFFNRQTEESVFSSVIDLLFNIAAFVFVGAWMPFAQFQNLQVWRLVVIAVLVLLLRRLPVMMALYPWIPDVKTFREAVFSGHFGPIGVGAIFISTLAAQLLRDNIESPNDQQTLLADSIQPIVAFMVLCSISIHGLSIPMFSLGRRVRTVSRTWSRHATQPEWATQARVVERGGADIIINRDVEDEMERGELEVEKVDTDSTKSGSDSGIKAIAQDDEPPDGNDVLSEWQEGPHRIIERRAGPGEEVEVEVIKNFGLDDSASTKFRVTSEQLHMYLDKLKEALVHDIEKLEEHVDRIIRALQSHHVHHISSNDPHIALNHAHISSNHVSSPSTSTDIEEEEGWASDQSQPSTWNLELARKRSKSPKQKSVIGGQSPKLKPVIPKLGTPPPAARKARRRNSIRRGVMMRDEGRFAMRDEERNQDRGRMVSVASTSTNSPSTSGFNTPASMRSRDQSPARSVRFSSGASTPRGGNDSALPTVDLNKVSFELPGLKP